MARERCGQLHLQSNDERAKGDEASAAPQQRRWEAHGALYCVVTAAPRAQLNPHSALQMQPIPQTLVNSRLHNHQIRAEHSHYVIWFFISATSQQLDSRQTLWGMSWITKMYQFAINGSAEHSFLRDCSPHLSNSTAILKQRNSQGTLKACLGLIVCVTYNQQEAENRDKSIADSGQKMQERHS